MSSLRAKLLGGDEPRPKVGGGKRRARKKKPAGERASNKRRQMTCTGLDEQKIWNVHFGGANAEGAESTETTQRGGVGSENHNPSLCALRPDLPLRSDPPPPRSISLEETMDLSDRAHDTRDPYTHFLVNADELNGEARPRVYPSCYMVGGGGRRRVSFETAEDELEGRRRRLASMGLEVHGVGSVSQMAAMAARKLGRKRLKGILEQETVQEDWVTGEVKGE